MKNRRVPFIVMAVALTCASAGGYEADSIPIIYTGSTLWSHIEEVVIQGDHAFCASQHGLMIYDISDISNPEFVSKYYLEYGSAVDIEVSGNYAYLCCNSAGLQIFDISNPSSPQKIGEYARANWQAKYMALSENTVVVSDDFEGNVNILDVSDPATPTLLGIYKATNGVKSLQVQGSYLYCGTYGGMDISNIGDPTGPDTTATILIPRTSRGMIIDGAYAYFINDSIFYVVSILDPASPYIIDSLSLGFLSYAVRDLIVVGDYVYTSNGNYAPSGNGGVVVINISNPAEPSIAGHLPVNAWRLSHLGNYIGVTDLEAYYSIMGLSEPGNPVEIGRFDIPHTRGWGFRGIETDGRFAYLAYGPSDLYIVDIADPANPEPVIGDLLPGGAYELAIRGDYLYLASGSLANNGLYIYDITNPRLPMPIGFYSYSSAQEITIHGDYAFMAGNSGISIILDISNPYSPQLVSAYRSGGITYGIVIEGDYAYLANTSGLIIVNISDINTPLVIDTIDAGSQNLYDVVIYKDYLLTCGNGPFKVRDISVPTNPVTVAELSFNSNLRSLTPYGDYIFLSGPYPSFTVLDMTTPAAPQVIGSHTISGQVQDIAFFDEYAYVIDQYGLMTFHVELPECCMIPGDANFNGDTDIGDVIFLVNYIFKDGPPVNCRASADANGDCLVNIGDPLTLINYLLRSGAPPICSDCIK